jgi:hypothetical protein
LPQFDPEQMMPYFTITLIGLAVLSVLLPIVIGFFRGGRRGSMKTVREVLHEDVSLEEIREIYVERLKFEGFEIDEKKSGPQEVQAHRGKLQSSAPFAVHTHASKPLSAVLHLEKLNGNHIKVTLTLRMEDFVVYDTGEGQYIDRTMDRLLSADLETEQTPIVPNLSFKSQTALSSGILVWLAALSVPFLPTPGGVGVVLGLLMNLVICGVMAGLGIFDCLMKPKEMKGFKISVIGVLLGFSGFLFGALLLLVVHGIGLG